MTFNVTKESARYVIRVAGELDAASTPQLKPTLGKIADEAPSEVMVDLSNLRLIDSVGLGAIVSLYKAVRSYDGSVSVSGVRDQPLVIFKLMQFDRVFMNGAAAKVDSASAEDTRS